MTDHESWLIRGVTIAGSDAKTSILLDGGSVTGIGPGCMTMACSGIRAMRAASSP